MSNRPPSDSFVLDSYLTKSDRTCQLRKEVRHVFCSCCSAASSSLSGRVLSSMANSSGDEPGPAAIGRLCQGESSPREVTSHTVEDGTTYSADIEYVYTVEGIEHDSDVVVLRGHSYSAQEAVSRYPLGKTVSVSYDPGKANRAVLEPGVESYEADELGFFYAVRFPVHGDPV